MHDLQTLRDGGYKSPGLTKLKLTCQLGSLPGGILELGSTLEHLDLSGTGLSCLPSDFGACLPKLRIAFFSNCNFKAFPLELASCPNLEMVAFRSNKMVHIPENAFPPRLRWLILTDNELEALPSNIGDCHWLEKCMLAGNRLGNLPDSMAHCTKLGLLRLSANKFESLPPWLFEMPELAFLSFAGNPCSIRRGLSINGAASHQGHQYLSLPDIDWRDLEVQHTLGEGASGVIWKALWRQSVGYAEEVAIKMFRGSLTSDGVPADEMAACLAAGSHQSLIDILGRIRGHPGEISSSSLCTATDAFQGGIVMQLIPPHYRVLGQPPSLASCTRDVFVTDDADYRHVRLTPRACLAVLAGVADAARHLHARGIAHGDLYAHNVLVCAEDEHALLGDFGAATIYRDGDADKDESGERRGGVMEKLEVLAFAHLVEDLIGLVEVQTAQGAGQGHGGGGEGDWKDFLRRDCG